MNTEVYQGVIIENLEDTDAMNIEDLNKTIASGSERALFKIYGKRREAHCYARLMLDIIWRSCFRQLS